MANGVIACETGRMIRSRSRVLDMAAFRLFTSDDAVVVASAALSRAADEAVGIESVMALGNDERRNLVLRARAVQGGTRTTSIIIKATRVADYDAAAANAYEASGFVREWAAMRYLTHHAPGHAFAPDLLASDLEQGVLVYDDLGDGLPSLVVPLLHGTADEAEQALTAYATALAELHRATIGSRDGHSAILRQGFPGAAIPPPAHRWIENVARVPHALLGGAFPEDEADLILDHLSRPGRWQALVHGDPCPDNILLAADGRAILIDFEFARPSHALFDAAYWRMGFPTCWCAGTVPAEVRRRIDRAYRAALADAVPEALDDDAFGRESAIIDVAWLLGSLAWRLEGALAADGTWGRATIRSRILTYLDQVIRSADEANMLPGFRLLAARWRGDLRGRWPDTPPLSAFPAFARRPCDRTDERRADDTTYP
jgi:aminoglycoside/choline kinase family phosphotransferase